MIKNVRIIILAFSVCLAFLTCVLLAFYVSFRGDGLSVHVDIDTIRQIRVFYYYPRRIRKVITDADEIVKIKNLFEKKTNQEQLKFAVWYEVSIEGYTDTVRIHLGGVSEDGGAAWFDGKTYRCDKELMYMLTH